MALAREQGNPVVGAHQRLLARVISRREVSGYVCVVLRAAGWPGGRAGQFALLQCEHSARFLPRPYSLHWEGGDTGEHIEFLVDPVGPASEELARAQAGERIWVLGPLGRGFDLEEILVDTSARAVAPCPAAGLGRARPRLVVVAGGVGLAPFPLLLEQVARLRENVAPDVGVGGGSSASSRPREVLILVGFALAERAKVVDVLERATNLLRENGVPSRLRIVTEDGVLGKAGLVTDLLVEELAAGDRVVVCGPHAMSEAVWRACADRSTPAWFSLEAGMACGVGSCHGCVIRLADGRLVRVCRHGPVMRGEEAFGNAHGLV